jgi:hypothetical protein
MSNVDPAALEAGAQATDIPRFLPLLDREKNPAPRDDDRWFRHTPGTAPLAEYATSMRIPPPRSAPERFKSIPSPWARLLLFQHALFSPTHPAHARIVSEWRGLLGCIALDGYLPLGLTATDVTLPRDGSVMGALREMAPGPDDPRWTRMALLRLGNRVVGGTSPHTLVFTGIRPVEASVPFREEGRLIDPAAYYGLRDDTVILTLLARWVRALLQGPDAAGFKGDLLAFFGDHPDDEEEDTRTHLILTRLQEWLVDIMRHLNRLGGEPELPTRAEGQPLLKELFPHPHPGASLFLRLRAIRPEDGTGYVPPPFVSDLRMRDVDQVVRPGFTGRVCHTDGRPFTGTVRLRRGFDAVVTDGKMEPGAQEAQLDPPVAPPLGEFFEPALIAVDEISDRVRVLSTETRHFFYPLRPEILQHLNVDDLQDCVRVTGDMEGGFEVVLSVPVQRGLQVEWRRSYPPDAVVTRFYTPTLGIWPDFVAPAWKHYYYFVRFAGTTRNLEMEPLPRAEHPEAVQGPYRWGRLTAPPAAWQASAEGQRGLLLAVPLDPRSSGGKDPWEVSVDFGSTNTRVFRLARDVNRNRTAEPVVLKPRACTLLGSPNEFPQRFFLSPGNHDVEQVEELRSLVAAHEISPQSKSREWLPADGVIFWQSLTGGVGHEGLRANLKWHENDSDDQRAFRSYITQLLLSVSAEAVAAGGRLKSVATAYPSVFPTYLYTSHQNEWRNLLKALGVEHKTPVPESAAVATYMVRQRGGNITSNLISVDVGGSTADLAVWSRGTVHLTDSVRFAGEVVGNLVATDAKIREVLTSAAAAMLPGGAAFVWEQQAFNGLIFNALLRAVAQQEENTGSIRLAEAVYRGPGKPGERLIAHVGYLFAALSYLAGLMVRRAGVRSQQYNLYFAGRGSEFLAWLDVLRRGASVGVPEAFFAAALHTPDSPGGRGGGGTTVPANAAAREVSVSVHPPAEHAKLEVGKGLLLEPLQGVEPASERVSFLGETGFEGPNGKVRWTEDLTFSMLKTLRMPRRSPGASELLLLRGFVNAFWSTPHTRAVAEALGITPTSVDTHADDVVERLFGDQSPWARSQATREVDDHGLLEPFFVTGARVLLEKITGNGDLFPKG